MRRVAVALLVSVLSFPVAAENSRPAAPTYVEPRNPARDVRYPGVLTLDVDATDTARAILSVRQTIPVQSAGPMTLRYPEWLPGKHAPRGPIAALAGLKITSGGKPVPWTRNPLDVYAFNIDVPQGASRIDIAFDYLSPTEGDQGRVTVTPDMLNLQWETVALYPAGHYTRQIRIRPSVTLPAGWTGVAALDGERREGSTIRFAETDFETLVDSPMFAGRHFKSWELGHNVDLNVVADRAEDLAATEAQIALHRRMVEQAVKLFGVRHFDRYEFLFALSDELGGIGLEHHRSSENALPRNYFREWNTTGSMRGLLAHEITHSWNGKFRRPAELWTPDFRTPMQDSLLWVYEGQTSFWDLVLSARSGLQPKDVVLGELAVIAAYYGGQSGRDWRTLADTTYEPVISARRPQAFRSYQRSEDYYNEGALIWLDADMLIREKTGGTKSLDDFARAFFGIRDGDWGVVTYTFDDVVAALNGVVEHDWAGFLSSRVNAVAPAPLDGLARGGYRLVFKDTPNAWQASDEKRRKFIDLSHSIGATIGKAGEVSNVVWDGPLFREGVTSSVKIVAVGGREYSDDDLKAAITAAKGKREPIRLLVKQGARYLTVDIAYHDGLRYPHLEKSGDGTSAIDRLLTPLN